MLGVLAQEKVGGQDALGSERPRGSICTMIACPRVPRSQKSRIGLYDLWNREENVRHWEPRNALGEKRQHQKDAIGAWCRIGGGQGALSHA